MLEDMIRTQEGKKQTKGYQRSHNDEFILFG